ncbi:MAG: hypothetical protein WCG42_06040 [Parachlamydiaceae bacterium]
MATLKAFAFSFAAIRGREKLSQQLTSIGSSLIESIRAPVYEGGGMPHNPTLSNRYE